MKMDDLWKTHGKLMEKCWKLDALWTIHGET